MLLGLQMIVFLRLVCPVLFIATEEEHQAAQLQNQHWLAKELLSLGRRFPAAPGYCGIICGIAAHPHVWAIAANC